MTAVWCVIAGYAVLILFGLWSGRRVRSWRDRQVILAANARHNDLDRESWWDR